MEHTMANKLTRKQAENLVCECMHFTGDVGQEAATRWVNLFVAFEIIDIEGAESLQDQLEFELRSRYFSGDQLDALQQALNAVGAKIVEK
jgi:hypothetical protein